MGIFLANDKDIVCKGCGKRPVKPTRFWGPYDESYPDYERWHGYDYGCRHKTQFHCLACFKDPNKTYGCNECGCEEELC